MATTPPDEATRIVALCDGNHRAAFEIIERQLNVMVMRTQVLLSLSGIVITVTGFSGKAIAQTSDLARGCIASGILVVLAAALVAIGGVLRLRWLTLAIGDSVEDTVARGLAFRDVKARSLRWAMLLFAIGFSLYCVAIAQLLIDQRPA